MTLSIANGLAGSAGQAVCNWEGFPTYARMPVQ